MKKELPDKYVTIIALLKFDDMLPMALTGFIAETIDTHEAYFHAYNQYGYDVSMIVKWDYLAEVLPEYSLPKSLQNKEKKQNG